MHPFAVSPLLVMAASLLLISSPRATEAASPLSFSGYGESIFYNANSMLQYFIEIEKTTKVPVRKYDDKDAVVVLMNGDKEHCIELKDNGKVGVGKCDGNGKQLLRLYPRASGAISLMFNDGSCIGSLAATGLDMSVEKGDQWCNNDAHQWYFFERKKKIFLINKSSSYCLYYYKAEKRLTTVECKYDATESNWSVCQMGMTSCWS